ncbi:hypothetical protein BASA81_007777 [Batrachochytrium salamandrivorans]|nr:hypothetical protein BASA81_007777 [Batrachochytrium salamandrivorans]
MPRLPSLFISHGGGPGFFMKAQPGSSFSDFDSSSPACRAFTRVGQFPTDFHLPVQPKLIVVISAHWEESPTEPFHVFDNPQQKLYYDYYGFPDSTYQLKYPSPMADQGEARKIVDLINSYPDDKVNAVLDIKRQGFDHGVFMPLMLLYPKANVPVVQISLNRNADPELHYKLGLALRSLRDEGALIIGSGEATHPMSNQMGPEPTAKFIEAVEDILLPLDNAVRLEGMKRLFQSPLMRVTHNPTFEHFIPLLVIMGTANGGPARDLFKNPKRGQDFRAAKGSFSMASFIFGVDEIGGHSERGKPEL